MKKLPKAPLQEVIFEVKWELSLDDQTQAFIDPGYQFGQGKFENAVAKDFPIYKSRLPADIPVQMLGHKTVHQFWKGERNWPVLQLGPGILTVNDTEKNYEWEKTYLPMVKMALLQLANSYSGPLNFISYSLKYIDIVDVKDYPFVNWDGFINQNMNFQFQNSFDTPGSLETFKFEQSFKLAKAGLLEINMASGKNNKKEDIFIWQTAVSNNELANIEDLLDWLKLAHETTSKTFKEICKKEFYGSFIHSK